MTEDEMVALRAIREIPVRIGVQPGPDRTLLYSYDVDRNTLHVYQEHGMLFRLLYRPSPDASGRHEALVVEDGKTLAVNSVVPNKRLYPEACDFGFCKELASKGVTLPFTTHDPSRTAKAFHGLRLREVRFTAATVA